MESYVQRDEAPRAAWSGETAVALPHGKPRRASRKRKRKRKRNRKRQRQRLAGLTYWQYLETPDWKRLRKRCLRRAHWRCACCGRRASQVHHKKYPPWGQWWKDKLRNLEATCGRCHYNAHSDPELPW